MIPLSAWAGTLALLRRAILTMGTTFFLGFGLFTQRLLPHRLSAVASRAYFYPTLPLTYARLTLLPPHAGLWTEVDDHVVVGAAPCAWLRHPERLHALGVRAVVNLCAEYAGPVEAYERLGVEQLRLPTVDHVEPSVADLRAAVDFIRRASRRGKVLVHCKAGHGRSAAVAYAWLLKKNLGKVAPFEVYEGLAAKRGVRKNLWRQPNLLRYYDQIKG